MGTPTNCYELISSSGFETESEPPAVAHRLTNFFTFREDPRILDQII
ncbi:hypothetical protein LEP1GSC048_4017 [Leptospira santarosai serovar Shermani str. 1342KT]|nr:hypothetical protein LEP1GSC048_4017 [Leptospira santarosai serovar Shermani str. 1342KT]